MRLAKFLGMATVGILLSGCQAYYNLGSQNLRAIAAEDLVLDDPGLPQSGETIDPTQIKEQIGLLVNQSETKCARFLSGLVLFETSTNTGFDVATTIFSALATVFTPISTVHALTASSSIASGTKTALDSDVYAKASIANFSQAIQSTYYSDMGKYVDSLATADPNVLSWQTQVYKIKTIHRECALAPAEASITAALQPTGGSPVVKLTVSYTVAATDGTLTSVANSLSNAINNSKDFQSSGIKAVAGPAVSIVLNYAVTTSITWTVTVTAPGGTSGSEHIAYNTTAGATTLTFTGSATPKDVITLSGTVAASTNQATANPTTPTSASSTTQQSVVPGHKP